MKTLAELLATHDAARARFNADYEAGRDWTASAAALASAEQAIIGFRPSTIDEARQRAAYILTADFLDPDLWEGAQVRTLLQSMSA